jgi:hypothetical protein
MKKTVSAVLIALPLNFAFGVNLLAQTDFAKENRFIGAQKNTALQNKERKDSSNIATKAEFYKTLAQNKAGSDFANGYKNTLANYERQKAAGKKFSTTKVLIGVAIVAAVIGGVVFAASHDKIKTF